MMIDRIVALLDGLDSTELDRMPPARLRQFSELCWHWHKLAERRLEQKPTAGVRILSRSADGFDAMIDAPKTGVLRDLKDGGRSP